MFSTEHFHSPGSAGYVLRDKTVGERLWCFWIDTLTLTRFMKYLHINISCDMTKRYFHLFIQPGNSLDTPSLVSVFIRAIHLFFHLHNCLGHSQPNAKEYKQGPLPAERVERDTKDEPPEQLEVREEIKGSRRGELLEDLCHTNPLLHPEWARARQRIDEEDKQQAGVDANVPVADGADGVDVG